MGDLRESFPTTEDRVTGAGKAIAATVEGQTPTAQNGIIGFAFKDSAGNVILPQLDTQGRLPVSTETQGTRLRNRGVATGVLMAATGFGTPTVLIASVNLTASKTYGDMAGHVSARRGSLFQMVYSDAGGSSVVLDEAIVDSGQYTANIGLGPQEDTFSVPASATSPVMKILGGNYENISDLHAAFTVLQF